MLIRLVPNWGFSKRLGLAPRVAERGAGRRLGRGSNAEQALERVEWEEPPVEAKRELVEVRLKMLRRDAMVNAIQPGLQVAEDKVDERQGLLRNVGIAALRDLREPVAVLRELDVARPSSVVMCVPGCTESFTKLSSDFAERSGATCRRTRPA